MIKKYVIVLIFFISYAAFSIHSSAEAFFFNQNHVMDDSNHKSEKPKNLKERIELDLDCTHDIHYTEAQKKRLDAIYHRIYMDYLELIETYAYAGALTQEQKIVRMAMLKNYILTFQKRNYKWCSEWEEDEWEEEWYNSDDD
ncbi:DUF2680 domain-containing protein [Neobacillus kokaensis]|uniref:DUF2680 domain-containing protein n=1 Tax=Neobacillus kokaensis TaxID=2759023 RepID=A0ABQ3MZN2_9BACI|nr:DUF2680 domain-containing protein [Neobacillus kokaensis]GHH96708.1 hypothetical protein AM1BK_02510 [Neobacillus kokaensis]